jgi:hypothetical protein
MAHRCYAGPALLIVLLFPAAPASAGDREPIERGVDQGIHRLKELQAADGSWPTHAVGATALVGLTLLECDLPPTDPAIQAAANYLRNAWTDINDLHTTYALSLTILFLDRLGEAADVPIIQTLGVRLLGGQNGGGGWSYGCPPLGPDELRRLKTLRERQVELKTKREVPRPSSRDPLNRPALPRELQQLVTRLEQRGPAPPGRLDGMLGGGGDNSNTQFAVLGLWAARRHGVPVEKALARTAARFRNSQHADGGWGYMPTVGGLPRFGASSPSMTCAGLLGLALGFGSAREATLRTGPTLKSAKTAATAAPPDPAKDPAIRAGFLALGRVIGQPPVEVGLGDMYYLLWSVERVAVAYGLRTIGNKDWYAWGAALLLAAQQPDGGWLGKFGTDVDTSFALLFLRRANLSQDLTAYLKGRDFVTVALKSGGKLEGAEAQAKGEGSVRPPAESTAPVAAGEDRAAKAVPRSTVPAAGKDQPEAARLSTELLQATGSRQEQVLDQLKQAKGVAYTDALAAAIGQLHGPAKTKARDALAERLARMTTATLRAKLQDELPEIRRAAALACALKEDKQSIPDLATLLEDERPQVARAAHTALKDLTGQDLGPTADASLAERSRAAAAWRGWWQKQSDHK